MKKSLSADLTGRLNEVSRGYIRKPSTIIVTIFLFITIIPFGVFYAWSECWKEFTVKCWRGV